MSWFPVLTSLAIAVVAFTGNVNPDRAITLLSCLTLAMLVWMGMAIRKDLKSAPDILRQ